MRRLVNCGLSVGLLLSLAASALGQWANNTTNPLIVGDVTGANENPQTLAAPDGGVYVLWRNSTLTGYETRVQRLDAAGVELWPHNGVVLGNSGFSFTVVGGADFDLASDGGVVVSYDGINPSFPTARNMFVQKLSPTGVKLWGSGGAGVPVLQSSFGGSPAKICAMPDGGCVVGVTLALTPAQIYFMRLNSSGATSAGWNPSNPPKIPIATSSAFLSCLRSGGADGSFITSWIQSGTQAKYITQKFTGLGAAFAGWPAPVILDNLGLTSRDFPTFLADGAGGAVYCWRSYGSVIMFGQTADALLQHIRSDGTLQFPSGPVYSVATPYTSPVGSGDPSLGRFSASVAYNPTTQTYFVASEQAPRSNGSSNSVVVQKIDAAGNRLWTDSGFFVTLQPGAGDVQVTATNDGGCMVFGTITRSTQVNRANFVSKVVDDGFGGGMNAWGSLLQFFNSDTSTDKGRMSVVTSVGSDDAIVSYGIGWGGGSKIAAAKITAATGFPTIAPTPASISGDLPATIAACQGDVVTLSVAASGSPTIAYRWYRKYAYPIGANPDAAWALNDGDSSYGCILPDDGTRYSGVYTNTLKIINAQRLPATLTSTAPVCTQTSDEAQNAYRCAVFNVGNSGPVFSGWAQLVISGKCHADFSCDGNLTIDDIFIFLNAWFAMDPRTDYDYSGSITIDDIFIYLNSWFAGCP